MKCCKKLTDGTLQSLPFRKTLATGYYDGPTQGFCECAVCGQTFSFRMFDWDRNQDLRIMAFAAIKSRIEEIIARLKLDSKGTPLILIPPLAEAEEMYLRMLFAHAPTHISAVRGWPGQSATWRNVEAVDLDTVSDWFAFLSIPRLPE